jgi:small subunit ribosomal protein S17
MKEKIKAQRQFKGKVISNKMAKTIVVEIGSLKVHPKYKKPYKTSKKYKVHDEKNLAQIGDYVIFQECRPLSKGKKWRLISIVKK